MLSQKLRGYFHKVVQIQEDDAQEVPVPIELNITYEKMMNVYRYLHAFNWDHDLAVMAFKISHPRAITLKEFNTIERLLIQEAQKNKNPLTSDEGQIKSMVEFLERTQDNKYPHKEFYRYFREGHAIWEQYDSIYFSDGYLSGDLKPDSDFKRLGLS